MLISSLFFGSVLQVRKGSGVILSKTLYPLSK